MKITVSSNILDQIKDLPTELQDKIIAEFVRKELGIPAQYDNNELVQLALGFINASLKPSEIRSRRDVTIYNLAQQGLKAEQIAQELNIGVSTVQHSEGWRNRKISDWI